MPGRSFLKCLSFWLALCVIASPALAEAPQTYHDIQEAQKLWAESGGSFLHIDVRFALKSGPGFGSIAHYWISADGTRIDVPVDRFGRFSLPALGADQARRAIIETDDPTGPVRMVAELEMRDIGLPMPYSRLADAAVEMDRFKSLLVERTLGGAAFLVKGFIPSTKNLDIEMEPQLEVCTLTLAYKDGDRSKLQAKAGVPVRLILSPAYARENPDVAADCPLRSIKPAPDKKLEDAPRFGELVERADRCRKIEAKFDRIVCASVLRSKGPNKPKGQVTVEEAGVESDLTGDGAPIEVWVEHEGKRLQIPVNPYGQYSLPFDRVLMAALVKENPLIESTLNAAYLQPGWLIAPVKPPDPLRHRDVVETLKQMDGTVSDIIGPVLAAIVPSFNKVAVLLEQQTEDCAVTLNSGSMAEQRLKQTGIEPVLLDIDDLTDKPDQIIEMNCPLRGFTLRAKTRLINIQILDKGFRYRRGSNAG